jgi:hypothetical protein
VVSEASARASLEASRQSTVDRATTSKIAAAAAITERDSLASRLALAEVEVKKLRAATASAEEAAERAKTPVVATECAAQAAAREKAALEAKVSELQSDLNTATTDLATTSRQFSQVTNQLQVLTEEASRLRDSNAKLSQDLDGKPDDPRVPVWLSACSLSGPDLKTLGAGSRVIRAGMVVQLATIKQERNVGILKVIEKDGVIKRSSEQLQSAY